MILYHGSKQKLDTIRKNQARKPGDAPVPENELLNAIYLDSDRGFAVAMAARPNGTTHISDNDGERTIEFEHPELFDPTQEVFLYEIDTTKIPQENLRQIDGHQWVIENIDEIKPDSVENLHAEEVFKYYELRPWRERQESEEFKFK
jgi:hypothetical protein